jgi:thermitase
MAYEYKANGKKVVLPVDEDFIAVKFSESAPRSLRASVANKPELGSFSSRFEVPGEKFTILPVAQTPQPRDVRFNAAMEAMESTDEVVRVAPVFKLGNSKVLATERLSVGFTPQTQNSQEILERYGCQIIEEYGINEYLVRLQESEDPFEITVQLDALPEVSYAEPDFVTIGKHIPLKPVSSVIRSNDPLLDQQYATKITKAVEAWNIQIGNPSIKIAVLDEGVDTNHEDLAAAIVGSYDGTDNDLFQEPNRWDAHGTACSGLAAAIHGNQLGIKGIGGGCSLLAIRIASSPRENADWVTSNSYIQRSIDWSWRNGSADILSNSWGGGAPSTSVTNAFERARTQGRSGKGCVIVIAAGNESGAVSFPGNLDNMLTVSASNEYDEPKTKNSRDGEDWWGSNFGPEVDVAAPGVHNYTTDISGDGGYNRAVDGNYVNNFNGTSSATPIVAGAAGLILSANPELTEAEVRQILRDAADKVGGVPYVNGRNDQMGYGRLNVLKALEAALGERLPLEGTIEQAHLSDGSAIAAFALKADRGDIFLLHSYQGSEALDWQVLQEQSLNYLTQFLGKRVKISYARNQVSSNGNILWGVSVTSLIE